MELCSSFPLLKTAMEGIVYLVISDVPEGIYEGSFPKPDGFLIIICCDLWLEPSHPLKMTAYTILYGSTVVFNVVKIIQHLMNRFNFTVTSYCVTIYYRLKVLYFHLPTPIQKCVASTSPKTALVFSWCILSM